MRRLPRSKAGGYLERDTLVGLGKLVVENYAARLHWYHKLIADTLEQLLLFERYKGKRGGIARAAISMPGRHGKSLHGVELLPALALGLNPDKKVMVGTSGAKLAKKSVHNTRTYMRTTAYTNRYATRLGRVEEIIGRDKEGRIEAENSALMFRTLKRDPSGGKHVPGNGYYMAQGIGGSLIGEGFDVGIMDDLIKNAEQALSPQWRKRVWDFYLSTFDTRADHPWAVQLYIGHRWTTPDFVDELLDHWRSESTPGFELPVREIKLPALAIDPIADYDPRELGEGLDVTWFRPRAWYESKRKALLAKRPWIWHGMYQQAPSFSGMKYFQPSDWSWYGSTFRLADKLLLVDFSIDAAMSETGNSYFVINVFGYMCAGDLAHGEAGEHFFWLDERRGHWTNREFFAAFEYLWRKWTRALPRQFSEYTIRDTYPGLYTATRVDDDDDETKHHCRPRVWVEAKAAGHAFISHYSPTNALPSALTTLTEAEVYDVRRALYPVPKARSKDYCGRTAGQLTAMGRMWLPKESFGEDPLDPRRPLVDIEPLGVSWERDSQGKLKRSKIEEGGWVHEMGNAPSEPDDRRDTGAQEIICRTTWMGPGQLSSG